MTKPTQIKSLYQFKAEIGAEGHGTLTGRPTVMGVLDRHYDVILPGAYNASVLTSFVQEGSLLVGHDWDGLPDGTITSCKVDGNALDIVAEFHSTPRAQEARQIAGERLARGKTVGMSIGFQVGPPGYTSYDSGDALLEAVEAMGHDMSMFDVAGISSHRKTCWTITRMTNLFEASIVIVPANPAATVTDIKRFAEEGSLAGLTLSEHLEGSLAGLQGLVTRVKDYKNLKDSDGRQVSPERLAQMKALYDEIGELLRNCAPDEGREDLERQLLRLRMDALAMGAS